MKNFQVFFNRRKLLAHENRIKKIFNITFGVFIILLFSLGKIMMYHNEAQKNSIIDNSRNTYGKCDSICFTVAFWVVNSWCVLVLFVCIKCFVNVLSVIIYYYQIKTANDQLSV